MASSSIISIVVFFLVLSLELVECSYLSFPRIHFAGHFRADPNTRNNDPCNARHIPIKYPNLKRQNKDWGPNGTNAFHFFDTFVTSVYNKKGEKSDNDALVGRQIIGNLGRAFAKTTELDVDTQDHFSVYGLKFGLKWSDGLYPKKKDDDENDDIVFHGDWTPNILDTNIWRRMKCYNEDHHGKYAFQVTTTLGVQSTTRIKNIKWGTSEGGSEVLRDLKQELDLGESFQGESDKPLAVRITAFYYTRNYYPYVHYNFTLGYVLGVIGVPSPEDTLSVPGARILSPIKEDIVPLHLTFEKDDSCYGQEDNLPAFKSWTNVAPFEVDKDNKQVHLDLSNSLPSDTKNSLRDIGTLRLGIYKKDSCVKLLGSEDSINYLSSGENFLNRSGIYSIDLKNERKTVNKNPLVLVQVVKTDGSTQVCNSEEKVHILLKEPFYHVRPTGHYTKRISRGEEPIKEQVYVTNYGKPVKKAVVKVEPYYYNGQVPIPDDGIKSASHTFKVKEGHAILQFKIGADKIPYPRKYRCPPCTETDPPDLNLMELPIDGQLYYFKICAANGHNHECEDYHHNTLAYKAYSDYTIPETPTWEKHIKPILADEYGRLSPLMNSILNLTDQKTVIEHKDAIFHSMNLSIDHPSFMPATRDLSPMKTTTIMKWLKSLDYTETCDGHECTLYSPTLLSAEFPDKEAVNITCKSPFVEATTIFNRFETYSVPPRCAADKLQFNVDSHSEQGSQYYQNLILSTVIPPTVKKLIEDSGMAQLLNASYLKIGDETQDISLENKSPLFMYSLGINRDNCNRKNVLKHLQLALQLEWATIPTYATSLYSIVEGCNTEIYETIESILIEEMLHFAIVGNLINSMGGKPIIDHPSITPTFPTRLPAGILPNLVVNLEKFTLAHTYEIFLAIESPVSSPGEDLEERNTIGAFYENLRQCLKNEMQIPDDDFNRDNGTKQVYWPWNRGDKIAPINSREAALDALELIIKQGEGAEAIKTPEELSHYYKFEEIICQKRMKKVDEKHYTYKTSTENVTYQPEGVWPMRSNPSVLTVVPNTNCYTESRIFHEVYRKFLAKLDRIFNGHPDEMWDAVDLMELLKGRAKRLMWTEYNPFNPNDHTTCGPVWDYEWPEDPKVPL